MKLTKILSLCLVAVLLVGAFALVGCEEKKEQNKIVQSNEKNIPTFSEKEKEQARFP